VRGSVLRVDIEHLPRADGRVNKTLWLWWGGDGEPDLELCFRAYLRRFDVEHTYRFSKNMLGWTTPSLCTPEQADRWTWLVLAALTQLRLARGLVDDLRLPWERPLDPAKLTPARVRRGFRRLRAMQAKDEDEVSGPIPRQQADPSAELAAKPDSEHRLSKGSGSKPGRIPRTPVEHVDGTSGTPKCSDQGVA